jgi:hypothetical protein
MEKTQLPGVTMSPRTIDTAAGKVEFDLTEGDGPVVLASHGGIEGVDQARLMLNWEEGSHLGFWLGPHGAEAQGVAREFLRRHRP